MSGSFCHYGKKFSTEVLVLRVQSNLQNIPRIFHKEMEHKHNKELHMEEYSIEYSAYEQQAQQLIYEAISGIFLEYSAR